MQLPRDCFFDPWGKQYCIIMDTDYDNQIDVSKQYSDFSATNLPRVGVGVFAWAKTISLAPPATAVQNATGTTKSDDIVSWQ